MRTRGKKTWTRVEALAAVLSMVGAILNALEFRSGFIVWLIANALWVAFGVHLRRWWLAALFAFYFGTSILGLVVWG